MTGWVALLRAVNVGGTGKLPMADLRAMAADAGFGEPRTYIASGNLLFRDARGEDAVRAALEARLAAYADRAVGVVVRTADEVAAVAAANPYAELPGGRVTALFGDGALPADPLAGAKGRADELVAQGPRSLFVGYPGGMRDSRMVLPFADGATARNMNTVAELARLARG